jgi:ADP-heptose:LPS heptosyltransferase
MLQKKQIKTIAIFRALQLGDMLCAVPAFRALRAAFPNSKMTLIGLPWAKDFAKRFSNYIDDFIPFPGYPGLVEQPVNPKETLAFLQTVQAQKFDLLLQLHGNGKYTNPLIMLMGAKQSAGFYAKDDYIPDHHTFFLYPDDLPEIHRLLSLTTNLGIANTGDQLEFPVFSEEKRAYKALAEKYSLNPKTYIILHPGARDPKRHWDLKNFEYVARELVQRGYTLVLTGAEFEKTITDNLQQQLQVPVVNLCGKTNLGELAEVIRNAALLISNDTGVSHVADAVQTPSVVIFQHSDPNRWASLDRQLHKAVDGNSKNSATNVIESASIFLDASAFVIPTKPDGAHGGISFPRV